MIKILNKYFAIIMLGIICSTACVFVLIQNKIQKFINDSVEHTIVINQNIDEKNKNIIINKLTNLTHQEVEIKEENDNIYVKIKCPPDKCGFFSKWLLDKKWNE